MINFQFLYRTTLCILWVGMLFSCQEELKTITPSRTSLTEAVYASVSVQPENRYEVYANAQGVIESLEISEGQLVKSGQILAKVKNATIETNVRNAQLSLKLAQDQLAGSSSIIREIEIQIESAMKQVVLDSANYYRQKNLWDKQIGSKAELDQRRLKYELSRQSLTGLQQQLNQLNSQLSTRVSESRNVLSSAKEGQEDFTLRSKIDGKVYSVLKEEGELISPQQPLAIIGDSGHFILEMQIDEVDIVKVQKGMSLIISLDAYGKQTFKGKVSKIYPTKQDRTQTFKVEGVFENPPTQLYAGLSGEANIIISSKDDVLTIPLAYLINDEKVKTKDGEVSVSLGARDLERVQVLSGIDENTELLKP